MATETFDAYNDFPSWSEDLDIIFKDPDNICEIEVEYYRDAVDIGQDGQDAWANVISDIRGRVGDQDFRDIYKEVPNSLIDCIEEKINEGD